MQTQASVGWLSGSTGWVESERATRRRDKVKPIDMSDVICFSSIIIIMAALWFSC